MPRTSAPRRYPRAAGRLTDSPPPLERAGPDSAQFNTALRQQTAFAKVAGADGHAPLVDVSGTMKDARRDPG